MNAISTLFLIVATGYLLGRITIKGMNLGSSGIILVALVFGHFGFSVAKDIQNLGLICFVTAVGYIAGPIFFRNFKKKAFSYIAIGLIIISTGTLICIGAIIFWDIPSALAAGLMCGALTSTPGLAAALEAGGDAVASVGYGIAYPFGVLGVVLFVQVIPRIVKCNIRQELDLLEAAQQKSKSARVDGKDFIEIDPFGFMVFSLAAVLGIALGNLSFPLPGGAAFSLGLSGGPLLSGLIAGHVGCVGRFSLKVAKPTLTTLREFGMILFLAGAGCTAGNGFLEVLNTYGFNLFFIGMLMTVIPMVLSFIVALKVFKLMPFTALGTICGGMTSTPALGSLIAVAKSDMIATAYAATYPIALVCVVLASQFVCLVF
ncbi:MAG: permease [Clostridia bacterium]|nr:permease [Clostridia bacterium]